MIETVRRMWQHTVWSDRLMLDTLRSQEDVPAEAVRELAHVLGTEECWLARIQARERRVPIWPAVALDEVAALLGTVHSAVDAYIGALDDAEAGRPVDYTNSAGESFTDTVRDILVHVALHGHYHRGKINLLLRQAGKSPGPADFIAWVRGAPAATEASSRD